MKPVNSKSLFSFVCDQMEKLEKSEITVENAKAQANLAKQANNLLKYELERAALQLKLMEFNTPENKQNVYIREIESKPFDSTI